MKPRLALLRLASFSAMAFSEPKLIALAHAFEQATHYRVPPASVPPLPSDHGVKK